MRARYRRDAPSDGERGRAVRRALETAGVEFISSSTKMVEARRPGVRKIIAQYRTRAASVAGERKFADIWPGRGGPLGSYAGGCGGLCFAAAVVTYGCDELDSLAVV